MRKSRFFAGMLAALFTFAAVSCANNVSADPSDLQDLLISTDKESVDLSSESFELKDGSSVIVTKPLTITGGANQYDLKGATITVKAAGAKIENVTNVAELIVDEAVGDGDFTVSNSNIAKLTVKGGGANSIHLDGTAVAAVTVAKEGVRLVLEGSTAIAAVDLQVACVLDSTSETAVIASVTVASTVKSVTLKGKTNITAIQATSKDFKIAVASNDIKIQTTVVKTEDGKVSAITVEAASEDIKVPETKLPEGIEITEELEEDPEQDLPDSIPTPDPDALLGPNSTGGHLSLEAVEGGIKVTVRILDGDIPAGKTLTSMNNFYIEETSTRIRLDLNKNMLLASADDAQVNEISGIFPFTNADTNYKFEYVFDMQDNGNDFHPWTEESAACKATSTGLSLNEYFDYDYAPYTAKVMVNDNGIMSINKDVSKFIRREDATIYLDGSVNSGVYDWSNTEWCTGWNSSIRNYEPGWGYRIDYEELLAGNANLGSRVLQDLQTAAKLCKRDTWFVSGEYKFSFPEIETKFVMSVGSVQNGEEASAEMFKALHLDNPFSGKTFTANNNGGYVTKINFVDDSTAIVSQGEIGSEPEVVAEYAYRVDFSRNKMYLETQKVNIGGTLFNREEYMETCPPEYLEQYTEEQLNIMVSQYFSRYEIGYSINPETNEVRFYGIMYDNPEDYLVNKVSYNPIYVYYNYISEDLYLWLEGNNFEIDSLAQGKKRWTAISVNNGEITFTNDSFTETITIPYEFKTVDYRNVLTITYDGQSYDLSEQYLSLTGTLSAN